MYNQAFILTTLKICAALLIAVVCNVILRHAIRFPKQLRLKRSETLVSVLRNIITVIVYLIAFHYILIILGVNIGPLLASAGIAGLAIGFGAKSLIEDLISGVFLLGQATIAIGDYVVINDDEGFIETISLRTLSIRDQSGALHIIPNGMVKVVTNYSRGKTHVYVDIPVRADQPIQKVLSEAEHALKKIQEDAEPSVYLGSRVLGIDNFTPGNNMVIRVDVITSARDRWLVSKKLRLLIKKGFEKQNIAFA